MIYDLDDNLLRSGQVSVDAPGTQILTIRVECRGGYFLRAAAADLAVAGRRVGDIDWTDLKSGQISLTPFTGTRQNFEISLTAAGVSIVKRAVLDLRVSL